MKKINGSICAPQGFLCAGVYAGIKKNAAKKDIALIYSQKPATAAVVSTINKMKAAPVLLTEQQLQSGSLQAIIINSGNANACTGLEGMQDAQSMVNTTANALHIPSSEVGVASTGVIGVPLPMEKIIPGIQDAAQKLGTHDEDAATAILTTDTFTKSCAVAFKIDGKTIHIGGIAKGSGMIHPMMATMLAFVTTDAAINATALKSALIEANNDAFNMISVDGDTSTNDMLLILANGMAGNTEITNTNHPDYLIFVQALKFVCIELAKLIALDGEGATKLIEIHLTGAASKDEARYAARAVCRSSLVKSAVFGEDANWGRIASAIGASAVTLDPNKLTIKLGDLILLQNGKPLPFDESAALHELKKKTVIFSADLGVGSETATAWGCDLTYDYIKINASYRS